MIEPNKPARGMDVLAWCLQAWHYMRQNRITVGPGLELRVTSSSTILSLKRRAGGGTSAARAPWAPEFFTEGTGEATVYKCRFNLGTVNNVPAGNWNAAHTLAADAVKFIVLTITTASGKVTGVALSVDTAAPTEDVIAKDTPPVTHQIVLGAIGKSSAQMIVAENLTLLATEVFRETKDAPATGGEPFSRWWRWSPYTATATS